MAPISEIQGLRLQWDTNAQKTCRAKRQDKRILFKTLKSSAISALPSGARTKRGLKDTTSKEDKREAWRVRYLPGRPPYKLGREGPLISDSPSSARDSHPQVCSPERETWRPIFVHKMVFIPRQRVLH